MIHEFTPLDWTHYTNIYEVNIRQYTPEGTFHAFAKHLPRLKAMGVHTLWLMPVTPISEKIRQGSLGSYYACSDYTSVNPEFGDVEDLKNLVQQAHDVGCNIIIDWVANHTGWDHRWTKEHPEFYNMDAATNDFKTPKGMHDIIELNYKNLAMQEAMIDAMQYWIDYCEIDGFRCDLAAWVPLQFWKKARKKIDAVKPLFWFGEYDELDNPEYGEVFDASYTWNWMHQTKDFYDGKLKQADLLNCLKKYDDLGDHTMRTWFTSNHDENSWNGTEYEKYGDMAIALAVFSCTWNGIPLMYSGQELPNRKRLKFFDKDCIDWKDECALADFYTTLLNVHTNNPALRGGDGNVQTFRIKTSAGCMAFLRRKAMNEVFVLINFSAKDLEGEILDKNVVGSFQNIFSGSVIDFTKQRTFHLPAWGFLLYVKQ
ncbi:MAG: 1,4-alpha-glucan branching protein [Chitinophagaceae bacterium]|nr:1,4-alpha-glucan branching protein [Chitinophagaceae bacterium]